MGQAPRREGPVQERPPGAELGEGGDQDRIPGRLGNAGVVADVRDDISTSADPEPYM